MSTDSSQLDKDTRAYDQKKYIVVVDQILRSVAIGQISVGDRLPTERDFATMYGVGRSSVREALLTLELSGVVKARQGAGYFLTGMGLQLDSALSSSISSSPRELLEVRQMIEPQVAMLSAGRSQQKDLDRLERVLQMAREEQVDDSPAQLERFVTHSLAFHREIAMTCGNATLTSLMSHLVNAAQHPLWTLVDAIVVRDPATRERQLDEHSGILSAIEAKDPELASEMMRVHLGALSSRIFGKESSSNKTTLKRRHPRRRSK